MAKYEKYVEYKDSGVEWLGEIPKDWSILKLKYAVDLISEKDQDGTQKYVGMENIASKNGKYVITEDVIPEGVSNTFKKDDVLFGKLRPYLAKSWLANFSGICSSELLVLRAKQICPKFLQYYTLTDEFINQVDSSTYGSKMPRASWDFISLLPIPKCSYELSLQIAHFLDHETAKIDSLIAKQEKLIELLKEKRQAVISHAVTKGLNPDVNMKDSGVEWLGQVPEHWKVVKLSYKLKLLSGDGITAFDIEDTGTYPVFGGNGLRGFTEKYNCDGEYALIGRQGALCGNINVARGKFFATEHAVVVYPYEKFNLTYLSEFLRFMDLGQYSVSAAQPGIAVDRINALPIVIPTLDEQNAIGDFLDHKTAKIDSLISKQEKQIELMQERRTALISSAVTGKINVTNWQNPNHNNNEANTELGA